MSPYSSLQCCKIIFAVQIKYVPNKTNLPLIKTSSFWILRCSLRSQTQGPSGPMSPLGPGWPSGPLFPGEPTRLVVEVVCCRGSEMQTSCSSCAYELTNEPRTATISTKLSQRTTLKAEISIAACAFVPTSW